MATTSSGFTPLCGSLPIRPRAVSTTLGMRVMPPTSTSSFTSRSEIFASFKHAFTGGIVRWIKSSVNCSNFERVSFFWMCFGPLASAVMNGRLISYSCELERAIFAVSASSLMRWIVGECRKESGIDLAKQPDTMQCSQEEEEKKKKALRSSQEYELDLPF